VARLFIVGGGCRGLQLARAMKREGHAVRVSTRSESHRARIEATGAECWVGTPDRVGTLRAALENVTIVCWLLSTATGEAQVVRALHTSRLEFFLGQIIDTTVRGFVYEAAGAPVTVPGEVLLEGERIVVAATSLNAIPATFIRADPGDIGAWLEQAQAAVSSLLGGSIVLGGSSA
jgi:hypothetical protein